MGFAFPKTMVANHLGGCQWAITLQPTMYCTVANFVSAYSFGKGTCLALLV